MTVIFLSMSVHSSLVDTEGDARLTHALQLEGHNVQACCHDVGPSHEMAVNKQHANTMHVRLFYIFFSPFFSFIV